jgi:hypothetical protein
LPAQASSPPERAIAEQAPERHEPGACAHLDRYEQPRADATPAEGDGQGEAPVPREGAGRDSQQQAAHVGGAVSDGAAAGTDSVQSAIVSGLSAVAASAVQAQKRCCQELLHRGTLEELLSATWVGRTIPMAAILPLRYWAPRVIS